MSDSIKVGIVSQWYSPEPVLIPKTISDSILATGSSVSVLTGFPNYPGGAIYPGFDGNRSRDELLDGARLRRVRSFVSHDQSAVRRIRSFLSFAWSALKNSGYLADRDVVYVYGTPMTAVLPAVALRIGKSIPFVIHVQDLWPESVLDSGMVGSNFIKRVLNALLTIALKPIYHMAHHIIVISPGMKDVLVRRGVNAEKISVLLNWHTDEGSRVIARTPATSGDAITCVYAGNIGVMQDVSTIILAAAEVQDEVNLEVLIYGSGVAEDAAKRLAVEVDARNVKFMGRVSMEQMRSVYSSSDFQLVTLKDREVFRVTIPSKFQAALANGVPVITTVSGDLAYICEQEGVGLVADPESPASLADAFRSAAMLGEQGRADMARRAHALYWSKLAASNATRSIIVRLNGAATNSNLLDSRDLPNEGNRDETK